MKRILFVDDEPMVLRGLQRTLYSMSGEWDMAFVESGTQALALMAQSPFDVVVADMRMPEMSGAELLNEVMQRYPRTVRLILSGHADTDLIMKCVGSTHQYLSKPCDPGMLRATIERAASLERSLQSETLRRLASQMGDLPTLPSLYIEIMRKLESPEVSLEEIAAIVARDLGMMAKLLKMVNSAFFGLSRQIADPLEAVNYLGVDTIKSLVLGMHVFSQFEAAKMTGLSPGELWRHSTQIAIAAKAIARVERIEPKLVDEAFAAGLLHDTGKLVLACNFGPAYTSAFDLVQSQGLTLLEAEKQIFGATHAEVGGFLLGLWGLPVPLVEAITLHHTPSQTPVRTFKPLTAVHVADALIHMAEAPPTEGTPDWPHLDSNYLAELGLADRVPQWQVAVDESLNGEAIR